MFQRDGRNKEFDRKRIIVISEKLKDSGMEKIVSFVQGIGTHDNWTFQFETGNNFSGFEILDQIDNMVKPELFEYENVLAEIKSCLVNKTCVLMTHLMMNIMMTGLTKFLQMRVQMTLWKEHIDIFDPFDNFEYLGCNADLSKEILKKISAQSLISLSLDANKILIFITVVNNSDFNCFIHTKKMAQSRFTKLISIKIA